jgi:hypothetical protein
LTYGARDVRACALVTPARARTRARAPQQAQLLSALERELVVACNASGVHLNAAALLPHRAPQLAFVAGLGPVKVTKPELACWVATDPCRPSCKPRCSLAYPKALNHFIFMFKNGVWLLKSIF